MSNRFMLHGFLSRFIACLTRLAEARKTPDGEDFYFYKKPSIPHQPIRFLEIGAESERQLVVLPGVNRAYRVGDVLKQANEVERWLNQRGLSLRDGSFLPYGGADGATPGKTARESAFTRAETQGAGRRG